MRLQFCVVFLLLSVTARAQPVTVYFFPGQGSDERLFAEIHLDTSLKTVFIHYPVPCKKTTLPQYAREMIPQIDTAGKYIFIGTSLGGMICTELADCLHPEKVIIISSAKKRSELPWRYRFQKSIPVNRIVPKRVLKGGARVLQPIVEPDRNKRKQTFRSMLRDKDPAYLKRTVNMIIHWDRQTCHPGIVHIHGSRDHTLPLRKVKADYVIKGGSHMMTLTRSAEINVILNELLKN